MRAEIRDVQTSEVFTVPAEGRTLGRMGMGKADFEVPHNAVSSVHARIFGERGVWFLEDLGSSNGTFVGTERIEGRVRLEVGLRFSLSRYKYEVVSLGDLSDDDPTGAWSGYPDEQGAPTGDGWRDDEGTSADPRLIETDRGEALRRDSGGFDSQSDLVALPTDLGASHRATDDNTKLIAIGGGAVLLVVVVIVLVVALSGSSEDEVTAAAVPSGLTEVAAASPVADPGPEPEPDSESEEPEETEEPEEPDPAPDAMAAYNEKLSQIEKALKKNKKLLKKKGVGATYKQLKKKTKQIDKKLRKKPAKRDAALLKQTGPLVDELHQKLF